MINSTITAPSPTKLVQFCPYTAALTLHRPIPILQKPDSNRTGGVSMNDDVDAEVERGASAANKSAASSTSSSKTPNELAELIKINSNSQQQQQHQLLSTLRSNSASNNSPLMFGMSSGAGGGSQNGPNNFISSFSSNSANVSCRNHIFVIMDSNNFSVFRFSPVIRI